MRYMLRPLNVECFPDIWEKSRLNGYTYFTKKNIEQEIASHVCVTDGIILLYSWNMEIFMIVIFLITRYRHPDCDWYRLGTLNETPRSGEVPGPHSLVRVHFQAVMIAATEDAYRKTNAFFIARNSISKVFVAWAKG